MVRTSLPVELAKEKSVNSEASSVDRMTPQMGTPALLTLAKNWGNRPSFAAACGISAQIIVQPFSAPIPEITTKADINLPAQMAPPKTSSIATENDAVPSELDNTSLGTMPNTAIRHITYAAPHARVPATVAIGTFLAGSLILAAATDANSTPR